jgi:hypothetical protein
LHLTVAISRAMATATAAKGERTMSLTKLGVGGAWLAHGSLSHCPRRLRRHSHKAASGGGCRSVTGHLAAAAADGDDERRASGGDHVGLLLVSRPGAGLMVRCRCWPDAAATSSLRSSGGVRAAHMAVTPHCRRPAHRLRCRHRWTAHRSWGSSRSVGVLLLWLLRRQRSHQGCPHRPCSLGLTPP